MARKNLSGDINLQCSYKRKFNEYCGFHKHNRLRIDEPLPSKHKKNKKVDKLEIKKKMILKINDNINILNNKRSSRLITLNDFKRGSYLKSLVKDLRYSLGEYKLPISGKKNELINRLETYFSTLLRYQPYINDIIKIQRFYRQQKIKKIFNMKGPGYFDRDLCINDYDFFTCDDKNEIDNDYFISYVDHNKNIYCFDARSIIKLLENAKDNKPINPYNLAPFPKSFIDNTHNIIDILHEKNIYNDIEGIKMTKEQLHRDKIVNVFQKLDDLDNHTKIDWFTCLTHKNLIKLYYSLAEIWSYRAGLSDQLRECIVPGGNLFKISVNQLKILKDKKKIQSIILKVIEKLVDSADDKADRILGSLYVLTALSEVSKECAEANAFLVQ
jgi:hypothetical protein